MTESMVRELLWETATVQHGFVTMRQAAAQGASKMAVQMLARRGTLERVAHGVYRFPQFPSSQYDPLMLAVLWTGCEEACLSHETALDVYGISDVNPNAIHVTVGKDRRLRRDNPEGYIVHYQNLNPAQIGWWQEIPTATPATAVAQCIVYGTPTYLLRQALERGHAQGYLTTAQTSQLTQALESRHA